MAHQELGRAIFKKIKDELFLFSKIERDAKMEGRRMTLVLQPDHKTSRCRETRSGWDTTPASPRGQWVEYPTATRSPSSCRAGAASRASGRRTDRVSIIRS